MREIKFRGRITQGIENAGQWIYWGVGGTDMIDVIDPETIGQFTGLKDKNGEDIYEGDIVSAPHKWAGPPSRLKKIPEDKRQITCNHKIIYEQDLAMFYMQEIDFKSKGGFNYVRGDWYRVLPEWSECEVIGNIYENPELLESPGA